jgi:hypothetical protein
MLALAGAAILVAVADPARCSLFPPCPLHFLTGLYCPGCGSLRALHQLLTGNLAGALSLNPLMVLSLPFLALLYFRPRLSYSLWLPWLALSVILLYGVLRNIPVWPFCLLAPH